MANFVLALDADPIRRTQFLERAKSMPAPASGLRIAQKQLADLAMIWWLGEHAPWSEELTPSSLAVLAGHAIDDGGNWLTAAQVRHRWSTTERGGMPDEPLDAYHVAVVYDVHTGLTIGGDLLGFFPVYYWTGGGVVLAASSSTILAAHPAFTAKPDLQGIAGMLMINGLVADRTLLRGARRLAPGHRLIVDTTHNNEYTAHEQFHYRLTGSDRFANTSFSELVEIVDAAMLRVIRRHTPPGTKTVQLISGGLDSRIVTGYIRRAGIPCSGICLGQPYDFEAQAAIAAADALEFPSRLVQSEACPVEFVGRTRERIRWLNLSAGIGAGELTEADAVLRQSASCFWSGMSLDGLLGGLSYNSGYDAARHQWSFPEFLNDAAKWGIAPARLTKLLRTADSAHLVESICQSFDRDYHRFDDLPHRLVFHARLSNRHRHHLGNILWQLSFFSWPLLFIADRQWLETMLDIPPAMIMHKRLEKELLRTQFPQLLPVPVDVNSWHHGWVSPTRGQRWRQRLNKIVPIERHWHDWYWRRWRGTDRRRYWRFYDFDGPKWRAVRHHAAPVRDNLDDWFVRDEADRLLPPPEATLPKHNAFGDAASRRNLLGLAIWSAQFSQA